MQERKRRPRRNRHYRIDHELTAEDLAAYCDYLREPRTTNKSAHAWLVAHGYTTFSESAVARHKRHYLEQTHDDRRAMDNARQWAELARRPQGRRRRRGRRGDPPRSDGGQGTVQRGLGRGAESRGFQILRRAGQAPGQRPGALGKLQLALKKAGEPAGGTSLHAEDEPAAPPLTEEQKEEEQYRKVCGLLKQPYHPPEVRAELKRKWEEGEARIAADRAAGRIKSLEEQFGGRN